MKPNIRPLKRFSQNFLTDPNISRKIVAGMQIEPDTFIVEIGPGEGVLTRLLLESAAATVTAVEVDDRLIPQLRILSADTARYQLIHQDFLRTDFRSICQENRKVRCVGNLPYSITSPILFRCLNHREHIEDLTVMVQKEVGERLCASPGSKIYGIPSVLFQAVSRIRMLFTVAPAAFRPVPKVDSAVLNIRFVHPAPVQIRNWPLFESLVKTAFNHRRKMLRNTLKKWLPLIDLDTWDLTRRPENLDVAEWAALANGIDSAAPS
ncbi:ribosomal RNA small subunit methyltransferase A [bacterium]|nr:ribosomal RNA small subunit methyltransferase A [bacterium]